MGEQNQIDLENLKILDDFSYKRSTFEKIIDDLYKQNYRYLVGLAIIFVIFVIFVICPLIFKFFIPKELLLRIASIPFVVLGISVLFALVLKYFRMIIKNDQVLKCVQKKWKLIIFISVPVIIFITILLQGMILLIVLPIIRDLNLGDIPILMLIDVLLPVACSLFAWQISRKIPYFILTNINSIFIFYLTLCVIFELFVEPDLFVDIFRQLEEGQALFVVFLKHNLIIWTIILNIIDKIVDRRIEKGCSKAQEIFEQELLKIKVDYDQLKLCYYYGGEIYKDKMLSNEKMLRKIKKKEI